MEKIIIENEENIENLWAEKISKNKYRIDNSPFYIYGYSWNDIVEVIKQKDGRLFVKSIFKKGGHSTYRIILKIPFEEFKNNFWKLFDNEKCTFEGADEKLIAIDVPPDADIEKIYSILKNGENDGLWVFEEANFEHIKN